MTNYEINMQKILEDYYLCLGTFINCSELYANKESFKIVSTDTPEKIAIKKGREADLLSNLGKVGEKAFKYIIGLENIRIYPNQDSDNFEALWKKVNTLKDFAKKHGIEETNEQFLEILNYYDENHQKAHNFDYWFSVMDLIMKDTSNKFQKFMEYTIQSDMLMGYCIKNNEFKYTYLVNYEDRIELSLPFRTTIFPNILELQYENIPSVPEPMISVMLSSRRKSIKKNGDIFTRLRYASNNPNNQKFNIDEVYSLIKNVVTFITMIHEANNNLDFDLNKSFAKHKALEYKEYLELSEEEIINLFNLDLTGDELALTAFESNYTYSSIKRLLDIGVPKQDIRKVMREGLQPRSVAFFYNMGITDYPKMREYLDYFIENGNYPSDMTPLKK